MSLLYIVSSTCDSLCWLCSFFVFKQKTAYELRISDWSSDVCSADLKGGRWARLCPRITSGARGGRALPPGKTFLSGLRTSRIFPVEIGRASCRERVCQYV